MKKRFVLILSTALMLAAAICVFAFSATAEGEYDAAAAAEAAWANATDKATVVTVVASSTKGAGGTALDGSEDGFPSSGNLADLGFGWTQGTYSFADGVLTLSGGGAANTTCIMIRSDGSLKIVLDGTDLWATVRNETSNLYTKPGGNKSTDAVLIVTSGPNGGGIVSGSSNVLRTSGDLYVYGDGIGLDIGGGDALIISRVGTGDTMVIAPGLDSTITGNSAYPPLENRSGSTIFAGNATITVSNTGTGPAIAPNSPATQKAATGSTIEFRNSVNVIFSSKSTTTASGVGVGATLYNTSGSVIVRDNATVTVENTNTTAADAYGIQIPAVTDSDGNSVEANLIVQDNGVLTVRNSSASASAILNEGGSVQVTDNGKLVVEYAGETPVSAADGISATDLSVAYAVKYNEDSTYTYTFWSSGFFEIGGTAYRIAAGDSVTDASSEISLLCFEVKNANNTYTYTFPVAGNYVINGGTVAIAAGESVTTAVQQTSVTRTTSSPSGSIQLTRTDGTVLHVADAAGNGATTYSVGNGSISYDADEALITLTNVTGKMLKSTLSGDFTLKYSGTNTLTDSTLAISASTTGKMTLFGGAGDKLILKGGKAISVTGTLEITGGYVDADVFMSGGVSAKYINVKGGTLDIYSCAQQAISATKSMTVSQDLGVETKVTVLGTSSNLVRVTGALTVTGGVLESTATLNSEGAIRVTTLNVQGGSVIAKAGKYAVLGGNKDVINKGAEAGTVNISGGSLTVETTADDSGTGAINVNAFNVSGGTVNVKAVHSAIYTCNSDLSGGVINASGDGSGYKGVYAAWGSFKMREENGNAPQVNLSLTGGTTSTVNLIGLSLQNNTSQNGEISFGAGSLNIVAQAGLKNQSNAQILGIFSNRTSQTVHELKFCGADVFVDFSGITTTNASTAAVRLQNNGTVLLTDGSFNARMNLTQSASIFCLDSESNKGTSFTDKSKVGIFLTGGKVTGSAPYFYATGAGTATYYNNLYIGGSVKVDVYYSKSSWNMRTLETKSGITEPNYVTSYNEVAAYDKETGYRENAGWGDEQNWLTTANWSASDVSALAQITVEFADATKQILSYAEGGQRFYPAGDPYFVLDATGQLLALRTPDGDPGILRISSSGDLPLYVPSGVSVALGSSATDEVLKANGDLTVTGGGALKITAKEKGITATENVTVAGGVITVTAEKNGICLEKGNLTVKGGTVTVTANRGINVLDMDVSGGKVHVKTTLTADNTTAEEWGAGIVVTPGKTTDGINITGGNVIVETTGTNAYGTSILVNYGTLNVSGGGLAVYHRGSYEGVSDQSLSGAVTLYPGTLNVQDQGKVYIYHESSRGTFLLTRDGMTADWYLTAGVRVSGGQLEVYAGGEGCIPFGQDKGPDDTTTETKPVSKGNFSANYKYTGGVVFAHTTQRGGYVYSYDSTIYKDSVVENYVFVGNAYRTLDMTGMETTLGHGDGFDRRADKVNASLDWLYWGKGADYQYYDPLNKGKGVFVSSNGSDQWSFTAPLATEGSQGNYVIDGYAYSLEKNQTVTYASNPVIRLGGSTMVFIDVDISWSSMTFTYDLGTWNPDGHAYEGGKWVHEDGNGTVTVTNHGSTKVSVSLTYQEKEEYADSFEAAIQLDGAAASGSTALESGKELTYTVSLTGDTPTEEMENVTVGTLTLAFGPVITYDTEASHLFFATTAQKVGDKKSGNDSIRIYDLDKCEEADFSDLFDGSNVVWEWSDPNGEITYFDAAKLRTTDLWGQEDQEVVIACTSTGQWVLVIDYETKELLYKTQVVGSASPHDIEMLPNGDLVVADTKRNLRYYALSQNLNDTVPVTMKLDGFEYDGHGVFWDPQKECLWVLHDTKIAKVVIENYGTADATPVYAEGGVCDFSALDNYGHAFAPLFGQPGKYLFSGGNSVWIFDSDTMTVEKADTIYQCNAEGGDKCGTAQATYAGIKGIACFEDGTMILTPQRYNHDETINTFSCAGFHIVSWEDGVGTHSQIKTPDTDGDGYGNEFFYKVFPVTTAYQ